MAVTPPTVGTVFLQADVNAAIAAVCAFIDQDRVRLDAAEAALTAAQTAITNLQSSMTSHASSITANALAAATAQGAVNSAMAKIRLLKNRYG